MASNGIRASPPASGATGWPSISAMTRLPSSIRASRNWGSSTVRMISPLRKMTPRPLPPAMPRSAIFASPGPLTAQAQAGEDVVADRYLFLRVGCQRDADRVADALREKHADADGAAHGAGARRARLGYPQVQRVRRAALVQEPRQAAVRLHHHRHVERLHRDLDAVVVHLLQDPDLPEGRVRPPGGPPRRGGRAGGGG